MAEWFKLEDLAPVVNRDVATLRRWCRQGMPHIREGRHTYTTIEHAQAALREHVQADRSKGHPARIRRHLTNKYVRKEDRR